VPEPPPVPETNPVLDRQQRMEQEMAELEEKRKEAEAMARKAGVGKATQRRRRAKRTSDLSERDFLATLRDPSQARRAILLREILGKPVGMR
jgi:type IV secretory pathway VirB10-like protein